MRPFKISHNDTVCVALIYERKRKQQNIEISLERGSIRNSRGCLVFILFVIDERVLISTAAVVTKLVWSNSFQWSNQFWAGAGRLYKLSKPKLSPKTISKPFIFSWKSCLFTVSPNSHSSQIDVDSSGYTATSKVFHFRKSTAPVLLTCTLCHL